MEEDKQIRVDIPDSIDSYKLTLFWGLTLGQIMLLFIATLLIGFGILSIFTKRFLVVPLMFVLAGFTILGIVEIRGRNFYRHILFIVSYYKSKPKVLIYNHYAVSGLATIQLKQLIYQKENNTKLFIIIGVSIVIGVIVLILTAYYLYYVLHS